MSGFKLENKNQVNFFTCPAVIDAKEVQAFTTTLERLAEPDVRAHVFDFAACEILGPEAYRLFIRIKQQTNTTGALVLSVNMNKEIMKQVKSGGLDMVFNPYPNMAAVLTKLGLAKAASATSPEAIEFIKPFVAAVQIAVSTQANTPLKVGKPFPKTKNHEVPIGIAGLISLASAQFTGTICLLFPTAVFLEIYENMLGEKLETITKESEDAAAELLNIIFGLAKMKLNNEKGYSIQKAIPTVLVGDKLRVASSVLGTTIVLPFETKSGQFFVDVVFDQHAEESGS